MRRLKSRNRRNGDDTGDTVTVRRGTKIYRIPVENGIVPMWALAQRFQEVGDPNDIDSDSPVVLPSNCTPNELIEWWINPSKCDIRGLDTRDSKVYDVSSVTEPSKRKAQRKIAVVTADPTEQARIRRILSDAFTADELNTMASGGSFVIRTVPNCGDATGCYYRRQDGVDIPLVVIEDKTTPDGIVHEVVHHIRAVDPHRQGAMKTTYPMDKSGKVNFNLFSRLSKSKKDKILADEERLTVAETVARTGKDPLQSGYYDLIRGKPSRQAYLEDRRILTDAPPTLPDSMVPRLKGKAAVKAVQKGYNYTNIARAQILSRNVRKR